MSPRAVCFAVGSGLLVAFAGCSHPKGAALSAETAAAVARPAWERARPDASFDPALVVTAQVAHGDIFVHTLRGAGPRYHAAEQLYRGQRAFILPFAGNYARDQAGRTDLTFELRIRKADGTQDGEPFKGVLWQDTVPSGELILFPASLVTFWTEPTDPLGEYAVTARVRDGLSGDEVERRHVFQVVDYTPPELPAGFDADRWFHGYYLRPTPELALSALPALFARIPADRRESAIPPLLGFYDRVLGDNAWLLPHFAARLSAAAPDEAYILSVVLGYHLRAATAATGGITPPVLARLEEFRVAHWSGDPAGSLEHGAQLDALWGEFFASGLYQPVRRLLEPLSAAADLGAGERWRAALVARGEEAPEAIAVSDLDDPAVPADVRREVVLRTALWSLLANARQHPLLAGYLAWSTQAEDVPMPVRIVLARALENAKEAKPSP